MVDVTRLDLPEIKLLSPRRFSDPRGFFSETFNSQRLAELGITVPFVQDNHSLSVPCGTVRGLHFQVPPRAQAKLVRVVRGSIFDVAVDIRRGSPSFGRHVSAVISAAEWNQIYIPEGFAHGFCTLEPDTEVLYKVSDYYAPEYDRGILWNDPALRIEWPLRPGEALLSDKDTRNPLLADQKDLFPA